MAADGFVERLEIEVVGRSGGPQGRVICSAKAASLPARSSANTVAGCAGGAQSGSN
jgi:hypothetical protein